MDVKVDVEIVDMFKVCCVERLTVCLFFYYNYILM